MSTRRLRPFLSRTTALVLFFDRALRETMDVLQSAAGEVSVAA